MKKFENDNFTRLWFVRVKGASKSDVTLGTILWGLVKFLAA